MSICERVINIDLAHPYVGEVLRFHEGDVNGFRIKLNIYNDSAVFDLTGCTAEYDAVIGQYLAEFNESGTISGNTVIIPVTEAMTAYSGNLKIDVRIIKNQEILFFQTLRACVQSRIVNDSIVEPGGESISDVLTRLDDEIDDIEDELDKTVKIADVYTNPGTGQLGLNDATDNDTLYIYHNNNGTVIGTLRTSGFNGSHYKRVQIRELGGNNPEISYRVINFETDPVTYGSWTKFASMSDIPDVSGLVPKTRTIAGADLQDDITATELFNALGINKAFVTPESYPYNAVGDGETDDTDAINDCLANNKYVLFTKKYAINTIKNGSGTELHGLNIPSDRVLKFTEGAGLVCISNDSCIYNAVYIDNKENITIDGMELQGDRSQEAYLKKRKKDTSSSVSTDQGYGVRMRGSKNITLKNCEVYDCLADGVSVWSSGTENPAGAANFVVSEDIRLINCDIHDNRRNGLVIGSAKNVLVSGCKFYNSGLNVTYDNIWGIDSSYSDTGLVVSDDGTKVTAPGISPRAGIDIEPNYSHNPVDNVTLEDCLFYGNGGFDFCNTQGTQSNISLVNCISQGGSALNDNYGLGLQRGNISIVGGSYRYISISHDVTKGIVQGALINEIYSSVRNREDVAFVGCHIKGLLGVTGESTATMRAASTSSSYNAFIVLKDCTVESCIPNLGYGYGYIVLEGCYVKQTTGTWLDTTNGGHVIAKNTEFHFEGNNTVNALIRAKSAEFTNCDFYAKDNRDLLISIYDTSVNKVWANNRFHTSLANFSPKGNALFYNYFNSPSSVMASSATGRRVGNIWTDTVDPLT